MNQVFDRWWHQKLGQPYYLAKPIDTGTGQLVVMLHGIGRTSRSWRYIVREMRNLPVRLVSFDLLGFGESPKPNWLTYDVDDHATAVINSIERLNAHQPAVLVGHSMGCLVAVRIAVRRPDLVRHLVLYEMPLFKGLPNSRYYKVRINFYTKLYKWLLKYEPDATKTKVTLSDRLAQRLSDLKIDNVSWLPYIRSLQNTIYEQTAPDDIPKLTMPMDVIYGSLDMLVIKGTVRHVYGKTDDKVQILSVRAGHRVTLRASKLIKKRIIEALQLTP